MSSTENHILWIDYKDYRFKIYIDIERKCLSGEVLINNDVDTWFDSDSLTHLIEQMERHVDNQINYKYQNQLAKEIIEYLDKIKELEEELVTNNEEDWSGEYEASLEPKLYGLVIKSLKKD